MLPQSFDRGRVPVAATNNLNFGNPERPEIMAQLVEAIEGIAEACLLFETPITGGNVSLYNETLGEAIWPTPVMGIVGLMKTAPPVTIPFKNEGRTVMLVGGIGSCDDSALRRNAVREGCAQHNLGPAAGARHGLRKARSFCDSRDRNRRPGGIRARLERWRAGGRRLRNAVPPELEHRSTSTLVSAPKSRCSMKVRRVF